MGKKAPCFRLLLHRFTRILDLALSGLDDRTIDLAGAHGDAGEADFVQAADGVDIATVLAADEDFELRIDGAGVSDEGADHLLDGVMDGDERMTLEEFLVDVERQEAVGVVAGNGECRLGEVVGTEGSESVDGVNVIVMQFVWVFLGAVLFRLRLNTHGFRRYALRAYAPLRPAMCSTAARSLRIRRASPCTDSY